MTPPREPELPLPDEDEDGVSLTLEELEELIQGMRKIQAALPAITGAVIGFLNNFHVYANAILRKAEEHRLTVMENTEALRENTEEMRKRGSEA